MNAQDRITTAQDRIDQAKAELVAAEREQRDCRHQWGKPYTEGRTKPVATFSHYEGHGSDPNPIYTYHDQRYSVWVRTCTRCGLKQETEKTEPVVVGHRPVF